MLRLTPIREGYIKWKRIDEKLGPDNVARVVERQIKQLDREQLDALYRGVGPTICRRH